MAVGAGGQDDAWAEAASHRWKANTHTLKSAHNAVVLIKGISTMCTADRKEQDHWGKNNNYTVQSDKTNTSKQARLLSVCACVCRLTATCRLWSPLLADSRFSPHEGREVACFPTVYSIWGLLPCTRACFITSSVFSATNPVATLLLMCLERLHCEHWGSSGVKSGDNAKVHVCLCVVLLTVLIAISQLTLERDDLAAGSWMRTQEWTPVWGPCW